MSPKILRRCDVCGKFHASYLVPAAQGEPHYYCYDCWKTHFKALPAPPNNINDGDHTTPKPEKPA